MQSHQFLEKFKPSGPWTLGAIAVDRKDLTFKTFTKIKEAREFIEQENGKRNLYFMVNNIMENLSVKPSKSDVYSAQWLHLDVDSNSTTQEELQKDLEHILSQLTDKLPKDIPAPTCIIFSGNGYWGFWKLKEPVILEGVEEKWEDFELYNKRLEQIFGGDNCFNVDRIARLPGTINIPSPQKRKKGRVEVKSEVLHFEDTAYDLNLFKKAAGVQSSTSIMDGGAGKDDLDIPGNIEKVEDLNELNEWEVPDKTKVIITQGCIPDEPKKKDNSRSAWLFDCVCSLVRCKVPDAVIYSILTDSNWEISRSVLELKSGASNYARRQILRAKQYVIHPMLVKMNDRHAVIGNLGGKCVVIEELDDQIKLHNGQTLRRSKLTFSSFDSIKQRYMNKRIVVGRKKDDSGDETMEMGKWWLHHPLRRQYDTMRFMPMIEKPGVYNLWRGFAYEALPGTCEVFLEHVYENICNADERHYDYLVKWMARVVQQPATAGEIALVLRGGKGAGKGAFARSFGRLFGRHYLHIANAKHLIGNFNAHLQDCVCLFADEAFFAGDKSHESVLKMLITEDMIPVEKKNYDVEASPNFVHLIMASNDPHVIRATGDERRYFVIDVGEKRKQDAKFFARMNEELEQGGYEALLYHLQSIPLEGYEVRNVPQTDALQEQKLFSLGPEEDWWLYKLNNGALLGSQEQWNGVITTEDLERDYIKTMDSLKVNRRSSQTRLGKFLSRVAPHVNKRRQSMAISKEDNWGQVTTENRRVMIYDFRSLDECRASWEAIYGSVEWETTEQSEPF